MIKKIVFFGTPEFAVASLDALYKAGYEIGYVVTVPDKPAGRGLKITESDVKKYAVEKQLQVLQPENLAEIEFINKIKTYNPDIQVVVAFRKLPSEVFSISRAGTINVHASLLPEYRGAAPINWALINGETETGITTFVINDKIDQGEILMQKRLPIEVTDNAGILHDKLKKLGAALLLETITGLNDGILTPQKQQYSNLALKKAPKIRKSDCKINWLQKGDKIIAHIKGLSPYPGAFTELISDKGERYMLKIYDAIYKEDKTPIEPGKIITDNKTFLNIMLNDGLVSLQQVQLSGKTNMHISKFLRGFQMNSNFCVDIS